MQWHFLWKFKGQDCLSIGKEKWFIGSCSYGTLKVRNILEISKMLKSVLELTSRCVMQFVGTSCLLCLCIFLNSNELQSPFWDLHPKTCGSSYEICHYGMDEEKLATSNGKGIVPSNWQRIEPGAMPQGQICQRFTCENLRDTSSYRIKPNTRRSGFFSLNTFLFRPRSNVSH